MGGMLDEDPAQEYSHTILEVHVPYHKQMLSDPTRRKKSVFVVVGWKSVNDIFQTFERIVKYG